MLNLNKINKIYFIGIGGIMMSALARYFLSEGKEVVGSDRVESGITDELRAAGAKIMISQRSENIDDDFDLAVYTVAIGEDNEEYIKAGKLGIERKRVFEVLGELSKNKFMIAVSGMHGKSTTTALLGLVMEKAGLDPTVFVGTRIKEWESNFRKGGEDRKGETGGGGLDYLLSEACEYKDNFLSFHPDILLINNIEAEHLDYFKNIENIFKSFKKLVSQIREDGWLVANKDNEMVSKLMENYNGKMVSFGLRAKNVDFRAEKIRVNERDDTEFVLKSTNSGYNDIKFSQKILGEFNVYNALGAIAVSAALGIKVEGIKKTLKSFSGVWRRFEFKGKKDGVEYYDDYAHHPTEIKATLQALEDKFPERRKWLIFQPHLYSRTNDFKDEFTKVLGKAENLILAEIYPAREENKWGISSKDVVELINKKDRKNPAVYFKTFGEIRKYLANNLKKGDVVMTMGAGDVWKIINFKL